MRLGKEDRVQVLLQCNVGIERLTVQRCGSMHHKTEFEVAVKSTEDLVPQHLDGQPGRLVESLFEYFDGLLFI